MGKHPSHRKGGVLRQRFYLLNLGGDLHNSTMCAHAQLSSAHMGAPVQCASLSPEAWIPVMPKPRSQAVADYRILISRYLMAVMDKTGWKQTKMGEAGGVEHTTIGRALKCKTTLGYPVLLSIAEKSGLAIPDELEQAARGVQDRERSPRLDAEAAWRYIQEQPEDVRRLLLERLQKADS